MLITDAKRLIKSIAEKQVHVPVLMMGPMGIGKCIVRDSIIFTEKGLVEIGSLDPQTKPQEVKKLCLSLYSKDGEVKAEYFYNNGYSNTLKIITKFGYELEGTFNHPIYVLDKDGILRFKKLRELNVGDYICIQRGQNYWSRIPLDLEKFQFKANPRKNSNFYTLPKTVTKEFARLLGYIISEGYMKGKNIVSFTNSNLEILKNYQDICKISFGISPTIRKSRNVWDSYISSTYIKQFLNYCGVADVLFNKKEIPWVILQSPKEIVIEYLRAYFEGDGSVTKTHIEVTTASEKMSKQLQIVLSNFGIVCCRRMTMKSATNGRKIKKPYWTIQINGNNVDLFQKEIGFVSEQKINKLQKIVGLVRNTNVDLIPFLKYDLITLRKQNKNVCAINKRGFGRGTELLGNKLWKYAGIVSKQQYPYNLTYQWVSELNKKVLRQNYEEILKHHFFFEPITTITSHFSDTVDFTVPNVHNFISNGLVSHNTQITEQAVKELANETKEEWGFVDLRLATQEPGELIGYPYLDDRKSKTGRIYKVLCHAQPEWFPEEGTKGILFLDELNRAPIDVRQAVFQLVKERRLHTHRLPEGWLVVSAINPDSGKYQVETLDPAMMRRFCTIKTTTNVEIWMNHAKLDDPIIGKTKTNDKVTGFIASHPDLLFKSEDFKLELEYSPDNWSMLAMLLDANAIPHDLITETAMGLLGRDGGIAFNKWLIEDYKRPVRGIDIIEKFDEVKDKLLAQKTDQWYVTLTELSSELFVKDSPTEEKVDNLVKFVISAPPEIVATFMSKLPPNYCGKIISRREVTQITAKLMRASREK